jgi:hypothetical protein
MFMPAAAALRICCNIVMREVGMKRKTKMDSWVDNAPASERQHQHGR